MTRPNCLAPSPRPRNRRGFTLIEILVVVVIIGILAALLVPAISAAVNSAKNAQVNAEITVMEQSLASFQNKYGIYPPSRIMVNESVALDSYPAGSTAALSTLAWGDQAGQYAVATDVTVGQLVQRTLDAFRKMFPKLYRGAPSATQFHDFNGSTVMDTNWYMLEGHECLVFFLGGVPQTTGSGYAMTGFAKSPTFPFVLDQTGLMSRTVPLFDFRAERLQDEDGDGVPGYLDPRNPSTDARFYAYFSANGSNGYDPNDMNMNDKKLPYWSALDNVSGIFRVNYAVASNPVTSPGPNPYTSSSSVPSAGTGTVTYLKKESYQIITAGADGMYGPGGRYVADGSSWDSQLPSPLPGDPYYSLPYTEARRYERDNLTNFTTGKLAPN